jgi:glycosyltransferase involved in cell wall biosynthesis
MKIAVIDPSLYTWPYDAELVGALRAAGHDVTLYGKALPARDKRRDSPILAPLFYRSLAEVEKERGPRALFLARKGVSHLASMARLLRALRRARPDVIHVQWLLFPAADRFFLAALRKIAPLVLTVHDTNPFNANPAARVQALGAIAIMRAFDRLIVHTAQGAERLAAHGVAQARVSVIAHGLLHRPEPAPPPPATDGPRLAFLQFGLVKPYKGVDVLIRAVAQLAPAQRARCAIAVVGRPEMDVGPLEALARELGVADAIRFDFRFVPDDELARLMREAAVLLFPYREIEASGVLMSALAWGRPVVASRIGLFAEIIADGRHGLLVPPDDPAALAAALARLVEDPALVARMAREVGTLAATIPSWSEIAARTLEVYDAARADFIGRPEGVRAAGGHA